ncbi:MAG: type II CRISPR RNA-guided endonuclease Cas9 [Alphaproteobacteria bacterium]
MSYWLGIDIGSKSLGWAAIALNEQGRPCRLLDIGVRIFPDGREPAAEGRTGTSLAAARRTARGIRRNRDRYLLRREDLMTALVRHGLMPEDERERKALELLDPYALRARGLDEPLHPHHFGRALLHLHQRRGFKSNRRTERGDKDSGKVKDAARALTQAIRTKDCRTLGEYLARRHVERRGVRARLRGEGAKAAYDLYQTREMVEQEFDALWDAQMRLGAAEAGSEAREAIRAVMFRQRPLRPVEPGKCTFDPPSGPDDLDGYRAPRALPLFQEFRVHQDLGNLRIVGADLSTRGLEPEERAKLAAKLLTGKDVTFAQIRRDLKLPSDATFTFDARLDRLKGSETAAILSDKRRIGPAWHDLGERQAEVVERLLADEDIDALTHWLRSSFGLSEDAAAAVADAPLPDGYGRIGRRALRNLLPKMRDGNMGYADAVAAIPQYRHHSDFRTGEIDERLPYYGAVLERHLNGSGDPEQSNEKRYGRFPNPTVHIGLNQFRRVVNAVIAKHGAPERIVVELARDLKLGAKRKEEIGREQLKNRQANEIRDAKLKELKQTANGDNRLRLRLWEELNPQNAMDRRCPYSGEVIGYARLFSDEVDVDHILPFSGTWDDSGANKIVCMRFANRAKGNRAPHDAFGHSPTVSGVSYRWDAIADRAMLLPPNKRWRFEPDAMARFEEEGGFVARQLTDTAYLARLTREYAGRVCQDVRVLPGRLTEMIRRAWGLNWILSDHNLKNRYDHRHHAIDACVAALTDTGLLNRISRANEEERERIEIPVPESWPTLRDDLKTRLADTVVSIRPDHGTGGRLHEDTAYGPVAKPEKEDGFNLVYRRPLAALNENEIARIRDRQLRAAVQAHVASAKAAGQTLKEALARFGADEDAANGRPRGVRRVRLLKKEKETLPIRDAAGVTYKAYIPGDNHHVDVIEGPDGKWTGRAVSTFAANNGGEAAPAEGRLVMRLHKGDTIRLIHDGRKKVMRVVQLEAMQGRVRLAEHHESGELQKRHDDRDDPFRWLFASYGRLKEMRARLVRVDETGRVHDPGWPG